MALSSSAAPPPGAEPSPHTGVSARCYFFSCLVGRMQFSQQTAASAASRRLGVSVTLCELTASTALPCPAVAGAHHHRATCKLWLPAVCVDANKRLCSACQPDVLLAQVPRAQQALPPPKPSPAQPPRAAWVSLSCLLDSIHVCSSCSPLPAVRQATQLRVHMLHTCIQRIKQHSSGLLCCTPACSASRATQLRLP